LHIFCTQPDLPVGLILIILKISQGDFKNTVLETLRSDLEKDNIPQLGIEHDRHEKKCTNSKNKKEYR
jgi:hypothetical protein